MDPDALREEADEWVREGIISREQAEEILARYDGSSRSRLVVALSLMGAVLVGAGIALFLWTNWEDLPRVARAIVLFGAPLGAYAAGGDLYRRDRPQVGHAVCVLGAGLVGVSLFLLVDLFEIGVADEWLYLAWASTALPTGHALDSRPATALGVGVLVPAVVFLGGETDPAAAVGLYGVALYGIAGTREGNVPWTYRVGGVAIALGGLLTIATRGGFGTFESALSSVSVAAGVGAVAATGWLASRDGRTATLWPAVTLAALLVAAGAAGATTAEIIPEFAALFVVHAVTLAALVAAVVAGYRTDSTSLVNVAAVFFLLWVLSFSVSTVFGALSGPVALVVAGLLLLAASFAIETGRRSILARM